MLLKSNGQVRGFIFFDLPIGQIGLLITLFPLKYFCYCSSRILTIPDFAPNTVAIQFLLLYFFISWFLCWSTHMASSCSSSSLFSIYIYSLGDLFQLMASHTVYNLINPNFPSVAQTSLPILNSCLLYTSTCISNGHLQQKILKTRLLSLLPEPAPSQVFAISENDKSVFS